MKHIFSKLIADLPNFAPKLVQLPVMITPAPIQEKVAAFVVNKVLEEAIEDGDLDFLSDKWLEVKVTDLNKSWFFSFDDSEIKVSAVPQQADASIAGEMNMFVLMSAQTVDPDTLFFRRKLVIEGDTELGLEVKNLLDTIEFEALPNLLKVPVREYAGLVDNS